MSTILAALGSLLSLKTIYAAVLAALPLVAKHVVSNIRRRNIADAVFHIFHGSETLAEDITDGGKLDQVLDKIVPVLDEVDKWMLANGWRPLKSYEKERAGMLLKSLAGQQVAAEQRAYASAVIVKGSPTDSPN
jgi:hypothetical protein